jgi:hypothetical protein
MLSKYFTCDMVRANRPDSSLHSVDEDFGRRLLYNFEDAKDRQ